VARTAILDPAGVSTAAVLGAMRAVALEHGGPGLTEMDRETIGSAATIVLGLGAVDVDAIAAVDPTGLARAVGSAEEAERAIRMLAVMSLADGEIEAGKTDLVRAYAEALGVDDDYLDILAEAAAAEIAQAAACLVRKNAESFPHLDSSRLSISAVAPFFPYKEEGSADPELEARYKTLEELPADTFGHAFFEHFEENGFFFPGNPNGLAEGFTTPHDSSHVLSGYSTKEGGEICVSTFIGAIHPDHPMAAEVLPVIFSWHLGVKLNDIANSTTGVFEPRHFWTAWERGAATTVDVVAADWDFWGATTVPLEELRTAYGVPPVDSTMLA
jgi:tellurite resistance protein